MKYILYAIWLLLNLFVHEYIEPSVFSLVMSGGSIGMAIAGLIFDGKEK